MLVLTLVITVGRDLFKPPGHPSLFTDYGIETRNLDFRHKRKPSLLALETNTLGAVEADKAEYGTDRAYNQGRQQTTNQSISIFMIDIIGRFTLGTPASNTGSTDPAVFTVVVVFQYGLAAGPAAYLFRLNLIHARHCNILQNIHLKAVEEFDYS